MWIGLFGRRDGALGGSGRAGAGGYYSLGPLHHPHGEIITNIAVIVALRIT